MFVCTSGIIGCHHSRSRVVTKGDMANLSAPVIRSSKDLFYIYLYRDEKRTETRLGIIMVFILSCISTDVVSIALLCLEIQEWVKTIYPSLVSVLFSSLYLQAF